MTFHAFFDILRNTQKSGGISLYHRKSRFNANINLTAHSKRLYANETAHGKTPPKYKTYNISSAEYVLHFILSGEGIFDGVTVRHGDVFLFEPLKLHTIEITSDVPLEQYWIGFGGSDAENLLNLTELAIDSSGKRNKLTKLCDIERIRRPFNEAVYGGTSPNDIIPELLEIKFIGVLMELLSMLTPSADHRVKKYSRKETYVQNAAAFLCSANDSTSVADAAKSVGLTEKYLCRLFREQLGVTPIEYLNNHRTQRATQLIQSTDLTIAEISDMLGFSDPTYFSRFFKNQLGITPTEYRNRFAKMNAIKYKPASEN